MKQKIELTSKLVVALIALVVFSAMTVPSVVAQTSAPPIRANSVTSESIKDGEVKTQDLANNAVTSPKIADGTIQEQDIADGVIPDGGGVEVSIHRVRSDPDTISPGRAAIAFVACPDGELLTGGGARLDPFFRGELTGSFSSTSNPNEWVATGVNNDPFGNDVELTAIAHCLDLTP